MSNIVDYAPLPAPNIPFSLAAFVQEIRAFMRDRPELNRLIEGEENSDRMILWAIIDAVDDFNATPPPLSFTFDQIPKSILRPGVVTRLLESVILLSIRNQLSYSDGGINLNLDKSGMLMQVKQVFDASWEQKKREWKISKNIEQGYSSVSSEYWIISGFYGAW